MGESRAERQTAGYACAMTTLFSDLADLPQRLSHPDVRDLAWALTSPPLLETTPWPQRHPLTASRWSREPGRLADWLIAQDDDGSALEAWLASHPTRRLGLYYERLWQFALSRAPDIRLLAANLPIRRSGHTLGELDLLLRDEEGVHHQELAIKLYFGPPKGDGRDPALWLGPDSQDRLARKLQHLSQHQLPLSASAAARDALDALGIDHLTAELWLGGYLFYPWPAGCAAPSGASPSHLRGRWLHRAALPELLATSPDGRWQPLPRRAWLAPARISGTDVWSADTFTAWLDNLPLQSPPQLLARLEPEKENGRSWLEAERVFLVSDDWPERTDAGAPLPSGLERKDTSGSS